MPDEFWANDDGLAVHYVMSGDVVLPESFGPEHVGRRWSVGCMSYLRFDGDRVCYEADFHDIASDDAGRPAIRAHPDHVAGMQGEIAAHAADEGRDVEKHLGRREAGRCAGL